MRSLPHLPLRRKSRQQEQLLLLEADVARAAACEVGGRRGRGKRVQVFDVGIEQKGLFFDCESVFGLVFVVPAPQLAVVGFVPVL